MLKAKEPNLIHANRMARRAFIKKAAISAVGAAPVMESLSRSDVLVQSASAASAPVNVTGTWDIVFDNMFPYAGGLQLQQSGNSLTGIVMLNALTGTINGNLLTFTSTAGAITTTYVGTVTGNSISGTWSNTIPQSGTWTATKV